MSGCLHIASSKSNPKEPPAFCDCKEKCSDLSQVLRCACGEEEKVYDWIWDEENKSHSTKIELEGREIHFHPVYSSGTAAVKGNKPFLPGNIYYWEIKVLTQLYGTDVMIGVGTNKVDFGASSLYFCSLLGSDGESWGFSYHGYTQHGDSKKLYGPRFGQGSLLGVYLDTWKGTLEFYLNHRPLGVAYSSLQDKILYPMMCSTAAKSKFRLIYTSSCQSSLQLLCLRSLSKRADLVKEARKIPFLRRMIEDELWWLFRRLVSSNSSSLRSSKNDLESESESESQDDTDSDYDDLLIQRLNEYVTKAPDPDENASGTCVDSDENTSGTCVDPDENPSGSCVDPDENPSGTCVDPDENLSETYVVDTENSKQENRKRRFLIKDSVPSSNLRSVDEKKPKNGNLLCNVCDVIY